jgi:hypothetical protein
MFLDGWADALHLHTPPRLFLYVYSALGLAHFLDDLPGLRLECTHSIVDPNVRQSAYSDDQ